MDSNSLVTNYNSLKEMVLDEEKLVTYVSLSKELCVHTNESKLLLNKLVNELDGKQSISVNFIISGSTGDNKALTKLCQKSDLGNQRKLFQNVFFEHIYSVAVSKPCIDNAAYMSVNKFEDFPLYTGLIKSNLCIKRSTSEIGDLKTLSQQKSSVQEVKATPQLEKKVKKEINGLNPKENVAKLQETKSEPIIKSEVTSPIKETKIAVKKNGTKSQKGIAGFFGKSNSTPAPKTTKVAEIKQEKSVSISTEEKIKIEKMETDEVQVNNDFTPDKIKKDTKTKDTKIIENSKNQSLDKIKKNAKVDKKRKRVLKVSDSESDGDANPFEDEPAMEQDNDSADEIPPTPTINTVKITSSFVNPKKKRKIVDKTYTDDEGYILTKKVEVYESCSENEEEGVCKENEHKNVPIKIETSPKQTKVSPKKGKKKISPPQKGKQATLMNFFKKK